MRHCATLPVSHYPLQRMSHAAGALSILADSTQLPPSSAYKIYLVQEYADMGNLSEALLEQAFWRDDLGFCDLQSVLHVALGIARGMEHIHAHSIIHGDLKPNNILIKRDLHGGDGAVWVKRTMDKDEKPVGWGCFRF